MAWRLAKSLETLRSQVNKAYPRRSKLSDGTIGDSAHAAVASDHNPNAKGVVTALDLTHDPKNGLDAHKLADKLMQSPRHPNLEYVISNGRIAGWWNNWKWAKYSGSNPHDKHIHISVGDKTDDGKATGNYDSTVKWNIGKQDKIVKPTKAEIIERFKRHFGATSTPTPKQIAHYTARDKRTLYEDILNTGVKLERKPTAAEVKKVFAEQLDSVPSETQIKHYTARDARTLYNDVMRAKPKAGYTVTGALDFIKNKLGV